MNQKRLYRSNDDRILAGVAAGVADYFDVDPVIVRIIWFLSVFFTGTLTFWAYIVMVIVVPPEPAEWEKGPQSPWAPGGAPIPNQSSTGYAANFTPAPGDPAQPAADASASTDPNAPATEGQAPAADANVPPASAPFTAAQNQWTPGPGDWRWQRRQDRWQRRQERWERRGSTSGGLMFGLFLIVVGGLLAWHQVDPHVDLGLAWPIGVIALGILLIASSLGFNRK